MERSLGGYWPLLAETFADLETHEDACNRTRMSERDDCHCADHYPHESCPKNLRAHADARARPSFGSKGGGICQLFRGVVFPIFSQSVRPPLAPAAAISRAVAAFVGSQLAPGDYHGPVFTL
jgi:hypothetical protein